MLLRLLPILSEIDHGLLEIGFVCWTPDLLTTNISEKPLHGVVLKLSIKLRRRLSQN